MRKTLTIAALAGLMSVVGFLGYRTADSYATEPVIKGLDRPYEISRLLGTVVKNAEGDNLGRIDDFILDRNGITLAIVSHGGFVGFGEKLVAVPLSSCSFDEKRHHFVLNVSKERFVSAPAFDLGVDVANRTWAEDTYRFFGLQPYWTESGYKEGMEWGATEQTEKERYDAVQTDLEVWPNM